MVRWCAYCQKFLGETLPFDDMSFTHGMCRPCLKDGLDFNVEKEKKVAKLVSFQKELWRLGCTGDVNGANQLLEQCFAEGVRPVDFLLGFMAPLLGHPETRSENFPFQALSSFCADVVEIARKKMSELTKNEHFPDVLLVTSPGNQHTFPIQIMELWLQSEGISTCAFFPKYGYDEIVEKCKSIHPQVLGFSISMREQVPETRSTIQRLQSEMKLPPLFLAGGYQVKVGAVSSVDLPEASLIADHAKLFLLIKTHLSLGFLYDLKKRKNLS
ncbi:MAG: hypothetical protein ACXWC9_06440 [Pseudobdellovibrionaceae bacterium]